MRTDVDCFIPPPENAAEAFRRAVISARSTQHSLLEHPLPGELQIDGLTYRIDLDVSVPKDGDNWFKRVFYGLWVVNCIARMATECLPKFKIEFLSDLGSLRDIARLGHVFRMLGIGFGMLEGAIVSVDFIKAIRRFLRVRAELSPEKLLAYDVAKARLITERHKRATNKARKNADPAARPDAAQGQEPPVPVEDASRHASFDSMPCAPLDPDVSGCPDQNHPIAAYEAAPTEVAALPVIHPSPAESGPSADECNAYLDVVAARCEKEKARADLIGTSLGWGRDFAAQGFRSSWDLAWTVTRFCGEHLASGVSYLGTALMGLGHMASGIWEHHQADKLIRRTEEAISNAAVLRNHLELEGKADRINTPFADRLFQRIQNSRRDQVHFARRVKTWGRWRIGYGVFSILLAVAGIATAVISGAAVFATGGLILIPIALTIGAIWLGHAIHKARVRNDINEAVRREKLVVEEVLAQMNELARGSGAKTYDGLEQWPLHVLESLAGGAPFATNRYLHAVVLAKRIACKSASEQPGDAFAAERKESRCEASAALQALGMSKTLTGMLKRSAFEVSHRIVVDYMYGEIRVHAHSD